MNKNRIIQFCANVETTLDEHLFAKTPEEEQSDSAGVPKTVAGAVATGAAVTGAAAGHSAIMRNYGGNASGSVGQAYRNAGRNAVQSVKAPVTAAIARGSKGYTAAREISGLNPIAAGARGLKKAANPLLAKLRGIASKMA